MNRNRCFVCDACGQEYALDTREWRCACGGFFEIEPWPAFDPGRIDPGLPGLWRYRHLLPLDPAWEPISLGEVPTPLVRLQWADTPCAFKIESSLPTGSFKDRGAAVLLTALRGLGVRRLIEDSSGNAGISVAAYAARAGIASQIFVPHSSSGPKLAQIAAYGAEAVRVAGQREDVARAAWAAVADGSTYASHVFNPYFLAGIETLAYELWEQLDRRAPSSIFLPAGNGTLLLGIDHGFRRLLAAGLVERVPHLIAIQATLCSPLYHAFHHNLDAPEPILCGQSIAAAISVGRPARGAQVLAAVHATGGTLLAVDEDQIASAWQALAHTGFYVEETAAAAPAALVRAPRAGLPPVSSDDPYILILTAHGLKTSLGWRERKHFHDTDHRPGRNAGHHLSRQEPFAPRPDPPLLPERAP